MSTRTDEPCSLTTQEVRERSTITVDQTAAYLHTHPDTVRGAIRRGEIRVLRLGRKMLIPTAPLLAQLGVDVERDAE